MCDCKGSKAKAINWCEGSTKAIQTVKKSKHEVFVDDTEPIMKYMWDDTKLYAPKKMSVHMISDMPYKNCFTLGSYHNSKHEPISKGIAKRYCAREDKVNKVFHFPNYVELGWTSNGAGHWCGCKPRPIGGIFLNIKCEGDWRSLGTVATHVRNPAM